jgi:hypothetical protein
MGKTAGVLTTGKVDTTPFGKRSIELLVFILPGAKN